MLEAPKQENTLTPQEAFRKQCVGSAQMLEEQQKILMQKERERQIRLVGYNVINTMWNLNSEDIKENLEKSLSNARTEQLISTGMASTPTQVILTQLDLETLSNIHIAIQNNPTLSSYLNSMNPSTQDNNIIEVVNRMQQKAKEEAKEYNYMESEVAHFLPNSTNIIAQLQQEQQEQKKQQKQQMEQE